MEMNQPMANARKISGATIAWGSGRFYDFDEPNPEIITLEDAAYALAYTVRWRGQTRHNGRRCFFGVAQHCTFGAEEMLEHGYGAANALAFLWHEPDEVTLPDMPGPVKPRLPGYGEFAKVQGDALLAHFGIMIPDRALCKAWDTRMTVTEKRDLLSGYENDRFQTSSHMTINEDEFPAFERRILPYSHPDQAAIRFMSLHRKLQAELAA